jgi:hemerythrin-like domain-containing protein
MSEPTTYAALRIMREEHAALTSVLRSLLRLIDRGPGDQAGHFFGMARAMLFYVDEFPERLHQPNESNHLFPRLARLAPDMLPVIHQLEADHVNGRANVRELQHLLLAWELLGETRRQPFVECAQDFVRFYLEHMRIEDTQLLPAAVRLLSPQDWREIDAVFEAARDPLAGGASAPEYEALFTRIVPMPRTSASIGVAT